MADEAIDAGSSTNQGDPTDEPIEYPRDDWRVRFVGYLKRKTYGNAAKQNENPVDRAARYTANATIWIAVFTFVSICVSAGTLIILDRQLNYMTKTATESTNQVWQAIGNMNWMARTMNASEKQSETAFEATTSQSQKSLNATVRQMQNQLAAYENAQAANLSIGDAVVSQDGTKVTYTLANTGQSVAVGIISADSGGSGHMTWDQKGVLDQMILLDRRVHASQRLGFSLSQGEERDFSFWIDPKRDWWQAYRFAYLDIFGQEHGVSACWTRAKNSPAAPCPIGDEYKY